MTRDNDSNNRAISNCDDQSIKKLELLIQLEEAKPESERDIDFIDECIKEIAEIKGVRTSFSPEEICNNLASLMNQSVDKSSLKVRKKAVRWLIPIAAVFLLSSVVVCAFPENRLAISNITNKVLCSLNVKTIYQEDNIDLVYTNDITSYSSFQDLSNGCDFPVLLPYDIENCMADLSIRLSDLGECSIININFIMNSENCSIVMKNIYGSDDTMVEYLDSQTDSQATWVYKQIYYIVKSCTRRNTELIVNNMR